MFKVIGGPYKNFPHTLWLIWMSKFENLTLIAFWHNNRVKVKVKKTKKQVFVSSGGTPCTTTETEYLSI